MKKPDFVDEILERIYKQAPWLHGHVDPKILMAVAYIVGKGDGVAMTVESAIEHTKMRMQ